MEAAEPAKHPVEEATSKVFVEETDESLGAFKDSLVVKDVSESWTAKFAKDAETQAGMPVRDRLDMDGVRYIHVEALLDEGALTADDKDDLEAALKGAYARRWRLLDQLTQSEQPAYKPRRK